MIEWDDGSSTTGTADVCVRSGSDAWQGVNARHYRLSASIGPGWTFCTDKKITQEETVARRITMHGYIMIPGNLQHYFKIFIESNINNEHR